MGFLLLDQAIGLEFFTQRTAIDAENAGSLALVAIGVIHDDLEQRPLHFAQDEIVKVTRPVTVQAGEVIVERVFGVFAKRLFAIRGREGRSVEFAFLFGHVCLSCILRIVNSMRACLPFPNDYAAIEIPPSDRSKYSFVSRSCSEALSARTA